MTTKKIKRIIERPPGTGRKVALKERKLKEIRSERPVRSTRLYRKKPYTIPKSGRRRISKKSMNRMVK
jgi:hypothetical protein